MLAELIIGDCWLSRELMDMQRYLHVLDKDLLTVDEELSLEPINYLVAH